MVKLLDSDIRTREVLDWKGLHLFHDHMSSCSQKLRIFLNLKAISWESHIVSLAAHANITPWYLGINPRGLLPCLVDNGEVHIESNDILLHLEATHPTPKLMPTGAESQIATLLKHEDDLHLDLRALSFRFVFAPDGPAKSPETLELYARESSAIVQGQHDDTVAEQIAFWQRAAAEGFTDAGARQSAHRFRAAFDDLESRLATQPYLLGPSLTVVDIAWFIYVNRLTLAGYPFARLHPRLSAWFDALAARPEFAREIAVPPPMATHFATVRARDAAAGKTLEQVAAL